MKHSLYWMQKPLIPLQLYVAWNKVVRYFNQKSCALHNCVFYKLWELPRSLRRCMKRSVTFPRLGHLTSACIAKSEYALWNSHKWTKLFVAMACNNNIDCFWLRNPSSLSSPPLSLLRSCSWCEMENMRILSSEDYLWAKQSVLFPTMNGAPSVVMETSSQLMILPGQRKISAQS